MNELKIFENEQFGQVRVVQRDGEPWFVAADVCRVLEISNNRDALNRLDDDEKAAVGLTDISSNGVKQKREFTIVNEPGLYSLVLGSRKPEAKGFKRWITHEVIPAIRRHGAYATPDVVERMLEDPDAMISVLKALKAEREEKERLLRQTEADAPKVLFANSVACSGSEILVGEMAKIIKQTGGEAIGQNRFFEMLRRDGYLISRKGSDWNMPTQKSMEMGLMRIKETSITHADGHVTVSKTPKITGKGQIYFVQKYADKKNA